MNVIKLRRIAKGQDSTVGELYLENGDRNCYIIEDEKRVVKVSGETRIYAGLYQIRKRLVETPMTLKYRSIYPEFFDFHLELQNVPGFKYVYIHHGNTEEHTDACLLTNVSYTTVDGEYVGQHSRAAFEVVYKRITKMLTEGPVFIQVLDEVTV